MQALREAGVLRTLAGAGAGGVRTPEDLEEVAAAVVAVVRELHGAGAGGEVGPARFGLGDGVDGVEEDFGTEALRVVAGEVLFVPGVVAVGNRAQLVGRAADDGADELLEVEAGLDEGLGQRVEQLGVHGRVGLAHVVFGLDEAAVEEVLPVAVHERVREEGVVLLAEPVGQRVAGVFVSGDVEGLLAEASGLEGDVVLLVRHRGCAALGEDKFLAGLRAGLAADLAEERAEAVVVRLAPLLIRMVVALGALEAQTEEELRGVFELVLRGLHLAIPSDGRVFGDVAGRGEDFARELVVRFVAREAVANPRVEGERAAHIRFGAAVDGGALVAEERAPEVGEVIRVVAAGQQAVNQHVALGGGLVGEEGAGLIGVGQAAREVEREAADEGRVVRDFAGRQSDALELLEDRFIHEIFGDGQVLHRRAERHGGAEHSDLGLVANHDAHVAGLAGELHEARRFGGGHVLVVRLEERAARHVLDVAVRVARDHRELLLGLRQHRALLRKHFDARDDGVFRVAVGHALRNPALEEVVIIGANIQPRAAAVRDDARALEQQQAGVRRRGGEPASARFLHEILVVFLRLEAEEREAKAVLPAALAVAAAAVAAGLGEDGDDGVREVDGGDNLVVLDRHARRRGETLGRFRRDGRGAVADG